VRVRNEAKRSAPIALSKAARVAKRDALNRAATAIERGKTPPVGEFNPDRCTIERACERCKKPVRASATRTVRLSTGRETWCRACVKQTGIPTV
jgi:hypothetical protein